MKKTWPLFLAFAVLLAVGLGSSQQPPQQEQTETPPQLDDTQILIRVNLVNVLFTVMDKKNHFVLGLDKNDISVWEDGVPQEVRFFSRETNLPLRVGILIDTSNSVRGRLRFEQQAAVDFLAKALRPKRDLAFVVSFDVETQLVQDLTDNTGDLAESIRGLQAGGTTRLYDAIYFSSREKLLFSPQPEPYIRRALIILSDGVDNQSEHSREEVLAMAQRSEVILYAISTNRTGITGRGDRVLKRLARETGGLSFFPQSSSELGRHFNAIASELRSQYSLGYVSTNENRDGTFREITIRSKNKKYRVRAKNGYFAPSE